MAGTRPPFRRRIFLIKHGFQARFALYPMVFLALFLLGAGAYLHWYLEGLLEFELYLPHSKLENPWFEITPVLAEVALWGGGAFLLLLGGWVWRRFGTLRGDLDRIADWMAAHALGRGDVAPPNLRDSEVAALGKGLAEAVQNLENWDAELIDSVASLKDVAGPLSELDAADTTGTVRTLAEVRGALQQVRDRVARVRVDESLKLMRPVTATLLVALLLLGLGAWASRDDAVDLPHQFMDDESRCIGCHVMERLNDEDWLLEPHLFTVSVVEACRGCHPPEEMGRSHPVGVDPELAPGLKHLPEDLPLQWDEEEWANVMTCGTCHDPHMPRYSEDKLYSRQRSHGSRRNQYLTYYLRMRGDSPREGFTPLCHACHPGL